MRRGLYLGQAFSARLGPVPVRRGTGSNMGALQHQTALNIRERAGRRKQRPVRLNAKTATSERWEWPSQLEPYREPERKPAVTPRG